MSHSYSTVLRNSVALLIASCWLANFAFAKDYKVEVLVFENLQEQTAHESYQYQAIDELSSNAELWPIEPSMLLEEVETLQQSEDYQLLYYYSWGQQSLPVSESGAMNVLEELMRGWVKVYAGQLLFINLDLDYNGYRLTEKRRIKLNEKHFFDHPKFGILVQVSRLQVEEDDLEMIEADLSVDAENLIAEPVVIVEDELDAEPPLLLDSDPQYVRNLINQIDPQQSTLERPLNSGFQ